MDAHKNFAISSIAVAPSPASTGATLTLAAGEGALMPAVPFQAVIYPQGTMPVGANAEIVRVFLMVGDAVTAMGRAQEGTTARNIVVGDVFNVALTKKTLDDIESAVALAAPIANPVHTGVVTAPTVVGAGAIGGQSLVLKASPAATLGQLDLYGDFTRPSIRVRGDGHTQVGTDTVAGLASLAPNCQVLVTNRDPTLTWNSFPTSIGCGLVVIGSTAEVRRVAGNVNAPVQNIQSILDLEEGTGGAVTQHVAVFGSARNYDSHFGSAPGQPKSAAACVVAGQFFGFTAVNTASGLHADASLPFGADIKGRVMGTVTDASHPPVSGIETGGADDSQHRQTNVGSGLRITNQGQGDIREAIYIRNTAGRIGAWEHGLVIATGAQTNLASNWTATGVYGGGEVVADAGSFWLAIRAVGPTVTHPASDGTHWVTVADGNVPAWIPGRDHDFHSVVTASGAAFVCAVAHGPSYAAPNNTSATNPSNDRWNGFNGTAAPDGSASATASAGHWNLWDNDVAIVDSWVNTSLTASVRTRGFPIYIGPVGGGGMNANKPTGVAQSFSIDTAGNMTVGGNIGFNGQAPQPLTGWVNPVASFSRASFDPSTVSLLVLAQHVAALVTDLSNNGTIG